MASNLKFATATRNKMLDGITTTAGTTLSGSGIETFTGALAAATGNAALSGTGWASATGALGATTGDAASSCAGTVSVGVTGTISAATGAATLVASGLIPLQVGDGGEHRRTKVVYEKERAGTKARAARDRFRHELEEIYDDLLGLKRPEVVAETKRIVTPFAKKPVKELPKPANVNFELLARNLEAAERLAELHAALIADNDNEEEEAFFMLLAA